MRSRTFWIWYWLAVAFVAFVLIPKLACAEVFVADLADKPGVNYGTFTLQAGVCGAASYAGKVLMDDAKCREVDWLPAFWITLGGVLLHGQFVAMGGEMAKDALIEQAFESAGCFTVLVF